MDCCCVCFRGNGFDEQNKLLVQLSCLHFICRSCFGKLNEMQSNLKPGPAVTDPTNLRCPVCRKNIHEDFVKHTGTGKDDDNLHLFDLSPSESEEWLGKDEFDINRIKCDAGGEQGECEEEANHFCPGCKKFMCDNCLVEHPSSHKSCSIEEAEQRGYVSGLSGILKYKLCAFHIGEPLSRHCTWCKTSVCDRCDENSENHCGHSTIPIEEATASERKDLETVMAKVTQEEERLRLCLRNTGVIKGKINLAADLEYREALDVGARLTKAAINARDRLIVELEAHRMADIKSLDFQVEEMEYLISGAVQLRHVISKIKSPQKSEELLMVQKALKSASSNLGVMKANSIHPEFYPPPKVEFSDEDLLAFEKFLLGRIALKTKIVDTELSFVCAPEDRYETGIGSDFSFYIHLVDTHGERIGIVRPMPVKIVVKGGNGGELIFHTNKKVIAGGSANELLDVVAVSFTMQVVDTAEVSVLYRGVHLKNSPFQVKFVPPKPAEKIYKQTGCLFRFSCNMLNKLAWAASIAITSSNQIAVADIITNTVKIFGMDGRYIRSFGGTGTSDGKFDKPSYITWCKDKFYISDSNNKRVQIFTGGGQWLRTISGGFEHPKGLFVTADGEKILITDRGSILWYSASGQCVNSFSGTAMYPLEAPMCVALLPNGHLVVSEPSMKRLRCYDLDSMSMVWERQHDTEGYFTVDDQGNILIPGRTEIFVLKSNGKFVNFATKDLWRPLDVKVSEDGRVISCEMNSIIISW